MARKLFAVSLMLAVAALAALAQGESKSIKIKGYLIDNMCAGEPGEDKDYEADAKGHALSCALMPHCAKTGFAVAEGKKLYVLDEAGNKLAADALKAAKDPKSQKGLLVEVEGTLEGSTLKATKLA
ncbi:MAG TPA: hypothetical protein VK421_07730, partial [Pyrinomonadaceae bacterium]|nr:hypothetical protein [Pyrinomonadaceae bacterium]